MTAGWNMAYRLLHRLRSARWILGSSPCPFFITGNSQSDYLDKYSSFVSELVKGKIALKIPALGKIYNLYYLSCGKYGSYGKCRGKFMVKLKEPNPGDRKDIV